MLVELVLKKRQQEAEAEAQVQVQNADDIEGEDSLGQDSQLLKPELSNPLHHPLTPVSLRSDDDDDDAHDDDDDDIDCDDNDDEGDLDDDDDDVVVASEAAPRDAPSHDPTLHVRVGKAACVPHIGNAVATSAAPVYSTGVAVGSAPMVVVGAGDAPPPPPPLSFPTAPPASPSNAPATPPRAKRRALNQHHPHYQNHPIAHSSSPRGSECGQHNARHSPEATGHSPRSTATPYAVAGGSLHDQAGAAGAVVGTGAVVQGGVEVRGDGAVMNATGVPWGAGTQPLGGVGMAPEYGAKSVFVGGKLVQGRVAGAAAAGAVVSGTGMGSGELSPMASAGALGGAVGDGGAHLTSQAFPFESDPDLDDIFLPQCMDTPRLFPSC